MTSSGSSGENLLLLAAAASLKLAQGRTADELGQLAAFCTVLGDNLALLALSAPSGSESGSSSGDE